jgi:hypothetical protein
MVDLLTHVLVPYILLTVASWRLDWLTERWIIIGMAGAAIPDLVKLDLLVDDRLVSSLLGLPFDYEPISSLGGVLLIAAGIALLFRDERQRVYGFLVFGGGSALVVDGLRVFADGRGLVFWLYPLWWRPPTPSLYVTSDPRVLPVALVMAAVVFLVDRFYAGSTGSM